MTGNVEARAIIIAAIIGAIAVIAAAWIGVQWGGSQVQQQAQATATVHQATSAAIVAQAPTQTPRIVEITSTPGPTQTPRIVEITSTPGPTQTAVILITTPTPTETPVQPEQPPLEVGQPYTAEGATLVLVNPTPNLNNEVVLDVKFTNNSGDDLFVRYSGDNFTARDDRGKILKVYGFNTCPIMETVLENGQTISNTQCPYSFASGLRIETDLKSCQVKNIYVTATNISRIKAATWKVGVDVC